MAITKQIEQQIKTDIYNKVSDQSDGAYVWMGVEYAYNYFQVEKLNKTIVNLQRQLNKSPSLEGVINKDSNLYIFRSEQLVLLGLKENEYYFTGGGQAYDKADIVIKSDREWAEFIEQVKATMNVS